MRRGYGVFSQVLISKKNDSKRERLVSDQAVPNSPQTVTPEEGYSATNRPSQEINMSKTVVPYWQVHTHLTPRVTTDLYLPLSATLRPIAEVLWSKTPRGGQGLLTTGKDLAGRTRSLRGTILVCSTRNDETWPGS